MPMETFVERLFEFMGAMGLNQNQFEIKCSLSHTNLREKKQGPTAAYLMQILTTFPELSMDWLFRGTGSMLLGESSQSTPVPSVSIGSIQTVNIGNWSELVRLLKDKV